MLRKVGWVVYKGRPDFWPLAAGKILALLCSYAGKLVTITILRGKSMSVSMYQTLSQETECRFSIYPEFQARKDRHKKMQQMQGSA